MRTYEPGQVQEALKCLKTVTPNNNFYHLNVWLQTKQKLNKRSERGSGAHGEVSSAQWIRIGSVYVVTKTHHPCITCVKPDISKRNYTVHSLHSPNRATHFETCVLDVTDKIRFATPSHWRWLWCFVPDQWWDLCSNVNMLLPYLLFTSTVAFWLIPSVHILPPPTKMSLSRQRVNKR